MLLPKAHIGNYATRVNIATRVFEKYGDFIYAVIRCRVRNETQVDDLFQDFFLSLVSKPPPAVLQNVKGYLYRAIINDIIDSTRRVTKYQFHVHRYAENISFFAAEKRPEKTLIEMEEFDNILKLIKRKLRDDEAQAIILRYMNDYEVKEIALEMGMNYKATWRCISSGLRKIQGFLGLRR